jgi:hypothetical protein
MNIAEKINFQQGKEIGIMEKTFALAVALLLSVLFIPSVNAGPNAPAATQTGESQTQKGGKSGQITEKKPGYSVARDYKKRVANKKKAAELRKKTIQEGK